MMTHVEPRLSPGRAQRASLRHEKFADETEPSQRMKPASTREAGDRTGPTPSRLPAPVARHRQPS